MDSSQKLTGLIADVLQDMWSAVFCNECHPVHRVECICTAVMTGGLYAHAPPDNMCLCLISVDCAICCVNTALYSFRASSMHSKTSHATVQRVTGQVATLVTLCSKGLHSSMTPVLQHHPSLETVHTIGRGCHQLKIIHHSSVGSLPAGGCQYVLAKMLKWYTPVRSGYSHLQSDRIMHLQVTREVMLLQCISCCCLSKNLDKERVHQGPHKKSATKFGCMLQGVT